MDNPGSPTTKPSSLLRRSLQVALILGASLGILIPLLRSRRRRRQEERATEPPHIGE